MKEQTLEAITKEKTYQPESGTRNANSRMIFKNHILTCQFLKDYVDLPIFKNLTPDDIQDVTEKYKAFLGVEFEADTVKYIKIQMDGQETDIFVISLIEHKSQVDYDISMQLLRYMTSIWYDYKISQNNKTANISSRKSFRYPVIIPIVYYEGVKNWTADLHLRSRIRADKSLRQFIPDFTYKIVQLHDYTNEELEEKNNEMSLVMMINKVQNEDDYKELQDVTNDFVERVYHNAPEEIKRIYRDIIWSLLMKMRVPEGEAQKLVDDVGGKGMGYLFENLKGIDIQAEREKAAAERQKAEAERQKAEAEKQKAEAEKQRAEAEKQRANTAESKLSTAVENLLLYQQSIGTERKELTALLMNVFQMEEAEAAAVIENFVAK